MESTDQPRPRKPRSWRSVSLRAILGLILVVGLPAGWWAGQAHQQRQVVDRLDSVNGSVVYEHEVLDGRGKTTRAAEIRVALTTLKAAGSKVPPQKPAPILTPASMAEAWKEWIRNNLGVEYVDTVVHVAAVGSDTIKDEDLTLLVDLPRLDRLNLGQTHVGDAGLVSIGKLTRLKALYLYSTKITDKGLEQIKGLDQLEELGIAHNGDAITDAGLASLQGLKKLRILEVGGPKITDVGLQQLENLPLLEQLLLTGATNVTSQGIARLQKAKPGLKITQIRTR